MLDATAKELLAALREGLSRDSFARLGHAGVVVTVES